MSMPSDNDEEYDVVVSILQHEIDILWKMTEQNQDWGMMDHIRLDHIDELKIAIQLWKEHKKEQI